MIESTYLISVVLGDIMLQFQLCISFGWFMTREAEKCWWSKGGRRGVVKKWWEEEAFGVLRSREEDPRLCEQPRCHCGNEWRKDRNKRERWICGRRWWCVWCGKVVLTHSSIAFLSQIGMDGHGGGYLKSSYNKNLSRCYPCRGTT